MLKFSSEGHQSNEEFAIRKNMRACLQRLQEAMIFHGRLPSTTEIKSVGLDSTIRELLIIQIDRVLMDQPSGDSFWIMKEPRHLVTKLLTELTMWPSPASSTHSDTTQES